MTNASSQLCDQLEDVMTIPKMLDWLERQGPKTKYDYCSPFGCAMSAYLKAQDFIDPSSSVSGVCASSWNGSRVSVLNDEIHAIDRLTVERPRTYGGLAVRMKDVLRARSSAVEPAAHNGLVGGSTPPGPTNTNEENHDSIDPTNP